jgi:uncharacterized protein (DUF1499 family)
MRVRRFGACADLLAKGPGLAVALRRRSWASVACSALALVLAAGTAAVPLDMRRTAESLPSIHDVTTDTERPPEFAALRAVRERSPNGAAYGGREVAAQQKQGYPDIVPVLLPVPPDRALARAEAAARALGWEIVAAAPAEGRLEATSTTRWFGFKDDVVVRVTPASGGSRVDIRSVSRIGPPAPPARRSAGPGAPGSARSLPPARSAQEAAGDHRSEGTRAHRACLRHRRRIRPFRARRIPRSAVRIGR